MSGPTETPDLTAFLAECEPHIQASVAYTGTPREEYVKYLTGPPRPGQAWSTALVGRLGSIIVGPLPPSVAREISRMCVPATTAVEPSTRAA